MCPSFLFPPLGAKRFTATLACRRTSARPARALVAVALGAILGAIPISYVAAQQPFTLDTPILVTAVGLRVRDAPGLAARIIASVPQGAKGVIVDASPHWADGYWWWHIAYRDGIRGWSADGDTELPYLILDPDPAAPQRTQPPPPTPSPPTTAERSSLTIVVVPSLMGALSLARHDLIVVMEGPETLRQILPSVASAFPVTVTFEGVVPGTYRVTAHHGGSRLTREITVRGRTLEVDFVMP